MKLKFGFFLFAAILTGFAAGQTSKTTVSHGTSSKPDPALKPLTPKSAMQPGSRSSAVPPSVPSGSHKADVELSHLEQQNVKAVSSKSSNKVIAKAPAVKSSASNSKTGSGINASYRKPQTPQK